LLRGGLPLVKISSGGISAMSVSAIAFGSASSTTRWGVGVLDQGSPVDRCKDLGMSGKISGVDPRSRRQRWTHGRTASGGRAMRASIFSSDAPVQAMHWS
jgi:hypothetical protein